MYNSERHQSCTGIARRAGYAHHSKHTACRRNQERRLTGEGAPTNPLSLKQSKMAVESGSEWRLCRMLAQILQNGKRLLTTRLELATSRLLNGCSTNRAPPAARCSKPHSYLLYMRIVCTVSGDLTCCAIAARYMLGGECFAGAKCSSNYKPDIITIAWTGTPMQQRCPLTPSADCPLIKILQQLLLYMSSMDRISTYIMHNQGITSFAISTAARSLNLFVAESNLSVVI